jgi:hypothetical protein
MKTGSSTFGIILSAGASKKTRYASSTSAIARHTAMISTKAGRYIRKYRKIILVEGIFDYFAFYNLLEDQEKPVVVSTLGTYLAAEAASILKGLDVEHFIVAYNWDAVGRNRIERIAAKSGGWVYYLGSLSEGQDPYDMLKPVVNAISGFSLEHPKTDAQCTAEDRM